VVARYVGAVAAAADFLLDAPSTAPASIDELPISRAESTKAKDDKKQGEYAKPEHKKGARPSTKDKHERKHSSRQEISCGNGLIGKPRRGPAASGHLARLETGKTSNEFAFEEVRS
jgi:hypothetical protein